MSAGNATPAFQRSRPIRSRSFLLPLATTSTCLVVLDRNLLDKLQEPVALTMNEMAHEECCKSRPKTSCDKKKDAAPKEKVQYNYKRLFSGSVDQKPTTSSGMYTHTGMPSQQLALTIENQLLFEHRSQISKEDKVHLITG